MTLAPSRVTRPFLKVGAKLNKSCMFNFESDTFMSRHVSSFGDLMISW